MGEFNLCLIVEYILITKCVLLFNFIKGVDLQILGTTAVLNSHQL